MHHKFTLSKLYTFPKITFKEKGEGEKLCFLVLSFKIHNEYFFFRMEPAITDPLLSSGSDTEHQEDSMDKSSSKAKIHPGIPSSAFFYLTSGDKVLNEHLYTA